MKRIIWFIVPLFFLLLSPTVGSARPAAESLIFLPVVTRSLPELGPISGPLLIDGEEGRIYTQAEIDGALYTVVLDAENGHLQQFFSPAGRLGLDRAQQRLVVDQGDAGVTILDATSGAVLGKLSVPGGPVADPQINADTARGYLFRESTIHVIDLDAQTIVEMIESPLSLSVCDELQGAAPITRSYYDPAEAMLHVSFTTSVCTPYFTETIVSYNGELEPVAQYEYPNVYQAVPFAGNLYGTSVLRGYQPFGLSYWAFNATEEWYDETVVGSDAELKGIVVDEQRNFLYEALWENPNQGETERMIRISDTADRTLLSTVPWERLGLEDAQLAGYDSVGDQLYFLEDGVLHILATDLLLPG